jgi:hypothetical protein
MLVAINHKPSQNANKRKIEYVSVKHVSVKPVPSPSQGLVSVAGQWQDVTQDQAMAVGLLKHFGNDIFVSGYFNAISYTGGEKRAHIPERFDIRGCNPSPNE